MGNLTALKVKHAKPGFHGDGKGLYLKVKPSGAASWVLRVQHMGKREDIGLGSADLVTLAEAREKAAELRKLARSGKDARAERDRGKVVIPTFAQAVDDAHKELSKGWADKTGDAFKASLEAHAIPVIGRRRVDEIESADVIAVLAPIWTEKPQQARKIRHRVLQVLAFAKSRGWRSSPVPGAAEIRRGLAKQPRGGNFAAMPYAEVADFVAAELAKDATSARLALVFAVLTAARSGEVRAARWSQFDLQAKTWTRPVEIMKSGRPHVVTLNAAAIEVLRRAKALNGDEADKLVFPGARGAQLSDMSISKMMRGAGRKETVHGFRSTFRDWAAEQHPEVPAMVAEMALAHSVGTATEQAYLRSDLRQLRFRLMDAWGRYVAPTLGTAGGNVVKLGAA
jgi:integrase